VITLQPPLPTRGAAVVVIPGIGGSARGARLLKSALGDIPLSVASMRPRADAGAVVSIPDRAEALADRMAERPLPDRLVLAGHSLGSYFAVELARRLERRAPGLVAAVVVAAQLPPHRLPPHADDGFDDETVLRKVTGGATPEALAANPALLRILIDQWRADYQAIDAYKPEPIEPIGSPLHVWTATQDPSAPGGEAMLAWREYTDGPATYQAFEGSHDFLFAGPASVAARLLRLATTRVEVFHV
jgi:pyochelin biosynthesis protein PchC